jgi:hypothetical protein
MRTPRAKWTREQELFYDHFADAISKEHSWNGTGVDPRDVTVHQENGLYVLVLPRGAASD